MLSHYLLLVGHITPPKWTLYEELYRATEYQVEIYEEKIVFTNVSLRAIIRRGPDFTIVYPGTYLFRNIVNVEMTFYNAMYDRIIEDLFREMNAALPYRESLDTMKTYYNSTFLLVPLVFDIVRESFHGISYKGDYYTWSESMLNNTYPTLDRANKQREARERQLRKTKQKLTINSSLYFYLVQEVRPIPEGYQHV